MYTKRRNTSLDLHAEKHKDNTIVENISFDTFNNRKLGFLNKGFKFNLRFKKKPIDEPVDRKRHYIFK